MSLFQPDATWYCLLTFTLACALLWWLFTKDDTHL